MAAGDPWQANANTSVNGAWVPTYSTYLATWVGACSLSWLCKRMYTVLFPCLDLVTEIYPLAEYSIYYLRPFAILDTLAAYS